ncbi:MAG: FAD/NAD(P)-binding protein [Solirubrobacterales bacterium]
MSDSRPTVAVIGGGLSGTLVAVNLMRYAARPLEVVLMESSGDFGPGIAYSSRDPQHRLNVPAARMSAFQTAPLHLLTWASNHLGREVDGSEYLPRGLYGEYLRELLVDERTRSKVTAVELIAGEAERIVRTRDGVLIEHGHGDAFAADAAVLATGNLPPAPLPNLPEDERIIVDPWAPGALDRLIDTGTTVIIGASLTAVDLALTVARSAPRGRTIALSRSGLVPRSSLPGLREPAPPPSIPTGQMGLLPMKNFLSSHNRRMTAEGYDWRDVVDGIRPCIPGFWKCLSIADRQQFLKGMAREWEVLRHRIAPDAKVDLGWLRQAQRFEFRRARVESVVPAGRNLQVIVETAEGQDRISADQIVCCTGVGTEIRRATGLIGHALEDGIAVSDPLGLGLRAGSCGALIDHTGSARGPIYAIGPLLRGELWETTAVREIRMQAEDIALDLCRGLNVLPPPASEIRMETGE